MSVIQHFGQIRRCDHCHMTVKTAGFEDLRGWAFITELGIERTISYDLCPSCVEETDVARILMEIRKRSIERWGEDGG